eukprot:TRINITY_DN259001_c0_g2_i3.p1 TRINITY_DN259001_c0_g2~~TRINITY_DN259001_c0_g2_i3.p1  ORF type:complete len:855 (+),score=269.66 TRINITY_DN259001_c0_g2_i3:69-2633(+)
MCFLSEEQNRAIEEDNTYNKHDSAECYSLMPDQVVSEYTKPYSYVLPALLRAVGTVNNEVDALCGNGLIMPSNEFMENIDEMCMEERDTICAALYTGVNWCREAINQFGRVANSFSLMDKVVLRTNHMKKCERRLKSLLRSNPNWKPPETLAQILSFTNTTRKPASRPKAKVTTAASRKRRRPTQDEDVNEGVEESKEGEQTHDDDGQEDEPQEEEPTLKKKGPKNTDKAHEVRFESIKKTFRKLDPESVCRVLSFPYVCRSHMDKTPSLDKIREEEANGKSSNGTITLKPDQFAFLLAELEKCVTKVIPKGNKASVIPFFIGKNVESKPTIAPEALMDLLEENVFPHIHRMTNFLYEQMTDGADSPTFKTSVEGLTSIFTAMDVMFRSKLSKDGSGQFQLLKLVGSFTHGGDGDEDIFGPRTQMENDTSEGLIAEGSKKYFETFDFLVDDSSIVSSIELASTLVKVCDGLLLAYENFINIKKLEEVHTKARVRAIQNARGQIEDCKARLYHLCDKYLRFNWAASSSDSKFKYTTAPVRQLLQVLFKYSDDPYETASYFIQLLEEYMDPESEQSSQLMPTLTDQTIHLFYHSALNCGVDGVKSVQLKDRIAEALPDLQKWGDFVRRAVNIIKNEPKKSVLKVCLQLGKPMLISFLKIVPYMRAIATDYSESLKSSIGPIQKTCRLLHSLVNHSKATKDVAMMKKVSPLKELLEKFVVKAYPVLSDVDGLTVELQPLRLRHLNGTAVKSDKIIQEDDEEDEEEINEHQVETEEETKRRLDNEKFDEFGESSDEEMDEDEDANIVQQGEGILSLEDEELNEDQPVATKNFTKMEAPLHSALDNESSSDDDEEEELF